MSHDPRRLVTATALWLEWAADYGVRYDDRAKSLGEVGRDYYQIRDSYRELASPDLGDEAPTASERMAANVAYARAPLIEAAIVARCGVLNPFVDPIEVVDPTGWGVPRQQVHEADPRWESPPPAEPPQHISQPYDPPDQDEGVAAVTEPALPLRDVPLIIEDLLTHAWQLADAGALPDVIEEILDQVAALREGRG